MTLETLFQLVVNDNEDREELNKFSGEVKELVVLWKKITYNHEKQCTKAYLKG